MNLHCARARILMAVTVLAAVGGLQFITASVEEPMNAVDKSKTTKTVPAPSDCAASGCLSPSDPAGWSQSMTVDIATVFMHAPR